ncbi:hypothetical protein LIER_38208 [Lithospermum erythrorhizon]|uniref:Integrase catalytic domain-containing protein n=1 Tax=Lithospermum erythrorhizon TaxID=34254 RepID=A0AAV3PYD7_LITER
MCTRLGIEYRFALVCYPLYNGQVEVMNQTIFMGIKKNILKTGETPFTLVYGTEAVLPIEVCLLSIRQIGYEEEKNEERLSENLYFVDEVRDRALGTRTYELEELSRNPIDHTWHGIYLKKYYV